MVSCRAWLQIAEIGLQALPALAFFTAENELNTGMLALAKRGVQLRCQAALLAQPAAVPASRAAAFISVDLCIQLRRA